jgi:hypothetical protein
MTKKNGSTVNVSKLESSTAAAPPITPPGNMPPAAGVLAMPTGWEPTPKKRTSARGPRPRGAQITDAAAAAKEITQSSTYEDDFGPHAPPAAQVAFVTANAATWRTTWQQAKRFYAYCTEQRAAWEGEAISQMDTLKPAYAYLAERDPKAAGNYPATARYLDAGSVIATRAGASRKAKTLAKAKAATSAAPPSPAVTSAAAKTLN